MDTKSWQFLITTLIITDTIASGQLTKPFQNDRVKFVVECEPPKDDDTPAKLVNVRVQPSLGNLFNLAPSPSDSYATPSPSDSYAAPSPSDSYAAPSSSDSYAAPSDTLPVQPQNIPLLDNNLLPKIPLIGAIPLPTIDPSQTLNSLVNNNGQLLPIVEDSINRFRSALENIVIPRNLVLDNLQSSNTRPQESVIGQDARSNQNVLLTPNINNLLNRKDDLIAAATINDQSNGQNMLERLRSSLPSIIDSQLSNGGLSPSQIAQTVERGNILDRLRSSLPSITDHMQTGDGRLGLSRAPSGSIRDILNVGDFSDQTNERRNLLQKLRSNLPLISDQQLRIGDSRLPLGPSSAPSATIQDSFGQQNLLERMRSNLPSIFDPQLTINQGRLPLGQLPLPSDLLRNISNVGDFSDQTNERQNILERLRNSLPSIPDPRTSESRSPLTPAQFNDVSNSPVMNREELNELGKRADAVIKEVSTTIGNALNSFRRTAENFKKNLNAPQSDLGIDRGASAIARDLNIPPILPPPTIGNVRANLDNVVEETQSCDLCNCLMKYVPKDMENGRFVMSATNLPRLSLPRRLTSLNKQNSSNADYMAMENALHPTYVLPPKNMVTDYGGDPSEKLRDFANTIEMEQGIQKLIEFVNIIDQVDNVISEKTRYFLSKLSNFYDIEKSDIDHTESHS